MSAETELYAALSGSAGLDALVSGRIYPDAIPEDQQLPALVFGRVSSDPVVTIDNVVLAEFARLNVTAWAATRTSAEACADAVCTALAAAGHPYVNRESGFDGETGSFAVTVDCSWFVNL